MADDTISDISMVADEESAALQALQDTLYCFEENRRKTFQDWPFDNQDVKCTSDAVHIFYYYYYHCIIIIIFSVNVNHINVPIDMLL